MSRFETTIPASYFDELYASDPDPWRFAESDYERAKYDATLAALPAHRYRDALEVGCSIGVLTHRLAARCDRLLGLDASGLALDKARSRCGDLSPVDFMEARVPRDWPTPERMGAGFDLILLSEVVYYLDRRDVAALCQRVTGSLAPGGSVVLVHWLGETHYPLSGDEAATAFIAGVGEAMVASASARTAEYRLDVLVHAGGRAAAGG